MNVKDGPAKVQRLLLSPVPAVKGAEIAVSWKPFGDVGGDFYDLGLIEEQCLGVTLGDVSGKGYEAALLMVYTLAEVRTRLFEHQRLTYLMGRLDESLRAYSSENKYAEVLVGTYSSVTRRFTYVQAGSICPVVFHAQTRRLAFDHAQTSRIPGMVLADPHLSPFVENTVELEKGDVLLVFSDGVAERDDDNGEPLLRRDAFGAMVAPVLKKKCEEFGHMTARQFVDELVAFLDALKSPRTDDETLVVIKAV